MIPAALVVTGMAAPVAASGAETAAASAMTVATLVDKVVAAYSRGPMAQLTDEYGEVSAAIAAASLSFRTAQAADRAAGRRPASCPPPSGTAEFTGDDLQAMIRAVPEAQRPTTTVAQAFAAYAAAKFPCPAG